MRALGFKSHAEAVAMSKDLEGVTPEDVAERRKSLADDGTVDVVVRACRHAASAAIFRGMLSILAFRPDRRPAARQASGRRPPVGGREALVRERLQVEQETARQRRPDCGNCRGRRINR